MCELKVVINKNVVFENAVYVTTVGNSVVVKDIMGNVKGVQESYNNRSQHNQRTANSLFNKNTKLEQVLKSCLRTCHELGSSIDVRIVKCCSECALPHLINSF